MQYTIPDYYREFQCAAEKCEDTCCAGWQIAIDRKALIQYGKVKGHFKKRIHASVNWLEGTFRQSGDHRCAFLNEENLCDLYTALGKESLCATCRRYPRHYEEFENVREITLSLSCPEVAGILLAKKEPVRFLTMEREGQEEYKDFDALLYSMLVDTREVMLQIVQNREISLELRSGLVLGLAHDVQVRMKRGEIFGCEELFQRYQSEEARDFLRKKLREAGQNIEDRYHLSRQLFENLYELEHLREDWVRLLLESEHRLYGEGAEGYGKMHREFAVWLVKSMPQWEVQGEQLLVYFLSTYFCGAVYDGRAYAKAQMAVVSVFLIYEMLAACWEKNERTLTQEDVVEIVYRYSRELEHSDPNLEKMERQMEEQMLLRKE